MVACAGREVFKRRQDAPPEPLAIKADTYVHFPTDLNLLLDLFIPEVVMPRRGKKNTGETEREKQRSTGSRTHRRLNGSRRAKNQTIWENSTHKNSGVFCQTLTSVWHWSLDI